VSFLYPFVELVTALLFAVSPLFVGWSAELFVSWGFISLLVIIFVSDVKYMMIPDRILLFFAGLFLILRILVPLDPWWGTAAGAAVGFGLLLFIAVISRGKMGGGDIKLFAVIGLVLGVKETLLTFFFSTLYGSMIGSVLMLTGKVKKGEPVPFGPFIMLGALTSYFYGSALLQWYFNLL
jgi:leader peptidase (prepilin peptidase)/N-methyltransferase